MSRLNQTIRVKNIDIAVQRVNGVDYLSLTDIIKGKKGNYFVDDWLSNRNTLEFLRIWENINNPYFVDSAYQQIISHPTRLSARQWCDRTHAIGIFAIAGRYGGTFAQKYIAFEFGMWINPAFKLHLIKEYERLRAAEFNEYDLEWHVRRLVSKANYNIQTSAVRRHLVEPDAYPVEETIAYADEADLVNLALFGMTATKWRKFHPDLAAAGQNIRDTASINELVVLSNLQSENAILIKNGLDKEDRYLKLKKIAHDQMRALSHSDPLRRLKRKSDHFYLDKTNNRPLPPPLARNVTAPLIAPAPTPPNSSSTPAIFALPASATLLALPPPP